MLQNEYFKIIIDNLSTAVLLADSVYDEKNRLVDFKISYMNESFLRMTKDLLKEGEVFSEFKTRLSPALAWFETAQEALLKKTILSETIYSYNFSKWFQITINCVYDNTIAVTFSDVSKAKEYEHALTQQNQKLESLATELAENRANLDNQLKSIQNLNTQLLFSAYHDSLTDLYNRAWLNTAIREISREQKNNNEKFGILLFDIDNMKDINDSRGHTAGDELIKQVATILRMFESKNTIPTRFGGDEFILLLKNIKSRTEAMNFSKKVLGFMNAEGIGVSGGLSVFPDDSEKYDDLLKFADMAKLEAKKKGKNNITGFQSLMQEKFLSKLNIETKLSKAMVEKNFQLYYQPQFYTQSEKLRGFEALLRWYDDELGWISPEQFVPLAEETHLVIPLGNWVLDTALRTLSEWEQRFDFDGIMSVNVSPIQFSQEDFIKKILGKIDFYKITPRHLEIEITEGVLIENVDSVITKLNEIKNLGIGISLDDFGTGYSSLRYLQMLPLTTLKIDKSFIKNIATESNIAEGILTLVSKMGLDTIAEGVEREEQLEILKKFNCNTIQGFLRGKPMQKDLCDRLLAGDLSALLTINNP
ncbi:MAG: bifunctional diguanylate cyclase/phosphodiesterase [Spirochaetales bacterium]|nr:bifunctional diguanylate cyclase/phosphodiesterase [Spirochaetales bacterium]